jgi:hypothetical protein
MLEDRTLLDCGGQYLFHPEAVLRADCGRLGDPKSLTARPVSDSSQKPPTPPNVLVNDPAEDGTSPDDTHSETSVLVAGSTVLVAYNDSRFANANPAQFTGFSRSTDRGNSFTDLGKLPTNPSGDLGDPSFARDNVTGCVYLATLSFGTPLDIWRSDDNMTTILPPVNGAPGRAGLDKEWLAVDNASGAGQGNVYLVIRDFSNGNGIYLFRSTDHGSTFGPNGGVLIASAGSGNVQGAWVAVGPDHAVYAAWYDNTTNPATIKIRKSTDQGQTFGNPVTITTLRRGLGVNGDLGLGGFRSNAFPQVVVNPVNGQVYAVYDDRGTGGSRADVFFRQSNDGGATWSAAVRVVDDTSGHDHWQPTIAVSANGSKVGVFWYDRRLDPANNLIDRFGAIGTVTGSSVIFGANFRISDTSFPPAFGHDPAVNTVYMGDYDQATADTGSFYVTWGDNRSPSAGHTGNRADVRFARIPVEVAGASVIAMSPSSSFAPLMTLRVTFDEQMDPTTATPDQFVIQDPSGDPVNVSDVSPVAGSSNQQFDVTFDPQTGAGTYSVTIGPYIKDTAGHYMDQDGDGIPGQVPEDQFNGSFTIVGPSIVSLVRTGSPQDPATNVRVTFNEPVDDSTFTPDQVASFTDPQGNPIPVNSVTLVDGSDGTQFDIGFDPQTLYGTYTMVIGPDIRDFYGNPMTAAFTGTFVVTPVYAASAYPFEDLDIHGQPGTFQIIGHGSNVSNPIDLGSHTFNFYGEIYTGNNQLYASSNALVTFGHANVDSRNTDLTAKPPEPAIAVLWSAWIRLFGTDLLEGQFQDNRLILQWNVRHVGSVGPNAFFQVILMLDTGGSPGDIIINYVNTDTGDRYADGQTSTVGVKAGGMQGMDRLLVSYNMANPLIGSGQAILISAAQMGPAGRGQGDKETNGPDKNLDWVPVAVARGVVPAPMSAGPAVAWPPLATPGVIDQTFVLLKARFLGGQVGNVPGEPFGPPAFRAGPGSGESAGDWNDALLRDHLEQWVLGSQSTGLVGRF